jgi:4-alpha-glucanotransferase
LSYAGLPALARLYGVQTAYHDVFGKRHQASPDVLLKVLRALGAPVSGPADIATASRARRVSEWQQPLAPVTAAWSGADSTVELRLPANIADGSGTVSLYLEDSQTATRQWRLAALKATGGVNFDGNRYVKKSLTLPREMVNGYHRLVLETSTLVAETLVIAAPRLAHQPPQERHWGVFLPLYALRRRSSWGAGNYTDLTALAAWTATRGGDTLATLPLLPTFLDGPLEVSPYSPVSRLMWHEFYLDLPAVPEFTACPEAPELFNSTAFQNELSDLRAAPMVDYARQNRLQQQILELMCRHFFNHDSPRRREFEDFCRDHPRVADYALFRAEIMRRGTSWQHWPQRQRLGQLTANDADAGTIRRHTYAQWLAHVQVGELSRQMKTQGICFSHDLPLGVHPDGYDAWREQAVFAANVSVGTPPDAAFTGGQDWGSPPLNPEALRRHEYGYFIECLRHHMQYAGTLRLDHMMGLHRQFWIPHGLKATDGVYVRYPAEEMYAILCLESARHRVTVVGEDLGTVPRQVRPAMRRHGLRRTYVLQYGLLEKNATASGPGIPSISIASLNTHDMPTFAGFWRGRDIDARLKLGLLNPSAAPGERERLVILRKYLLELIRRYTGATPTEEEIQAIIRANLNLLAASPAETVLVNMEDLWGETHFQNIPGTASSSRPNWRPRAKFSLEEFDGLRSVTETLDELNTIRKRRG